MDMTALVYTCIVKMQQHRLLSICMLAKLSGVYDFIGSACVHSLAKRQSE